MRCVEQGNQWCAYWFDSRCHIDDWYEEKSGCIEPHITPLFQDTNHMLEVISQKELNAQVDICKMIIKGAVPNNPLNRVQVVETYEVKESCGRFLYQLACHNVVESPAETLLVEQEKGEWV